MGKLDEPQKFHFQRFLNEILPENKTHPHVAANDIQKKYNKIHGKKHKALN